jgi:hypothetical protein
MLKLSRLRHSLLNAQPRAAGVIALASLWPLLRLTCV